MVLKKNIYPERFIYFLILIISFFVLTPMILPHVWPNVIEKERYVLLVDLFKDSFLNGVLYPRWLPDLYGGWGYPLFIFYQPGFFFATLPFSFLPGYPLSTMYITILFLFFMGGIGCYKLCKELTDLITGFFCAAFFLLTPYLYMNLYVRGDLSELMGILLCPWPIYFLIVLKKHVNDHVKSLKAVFGIVVSLIILIISHPAVALFFFPIFCIYTMCMGFEISCFKKEFIFKTAIAIALAMVLSSPYWFAIFQMKKYVNFNGMLSDYYLPEHHFVYFKQFFLRTWNFGGGSDVGIPHDEFSFQLGLPHFLLASIGFLMAWRKNVIIRVSYIIYFVFIFLMTPSEFVTWIWKKIYLMRHMQFPWRILSVTALLQIICSSGIRDFLLTFKSARNKIIIVLVLLFASTLWYLNQFQISKGSARLGREQLLEIKKISIHAEYTGTSECEFMPMTALKCLYRKPRGNMPLLILNPSGRIKGLDGNSKYRIKYLVSADIYANVIINQIYLPGWRVIIDGNDIPAVLLERYLTYDGRIQFPILPGKSHVIEAFYDGPPGWRVHNVIIALLFFILTALLILCKNNYSLVCERNFFGPFTGVSNKKRG